MKHTTDSSTGSLSDAAPNATTDAVIAPQPDPAGLARVHWLRHATPLGDLVLAASDAGLRGAWFDGQAHFGGPDARWSAQPAGVAAGWLDAARSQLDGWFAGCRQGFDVALDPLGTPFQRRVWRAIAQIGFGARLGYGEVAAAIGQPSAARAVGAATGRNPISLIVPCHRLVGRSGALTGYAGGLARKQALLAFEAGDVAAARALEGYRHELAHANVGAA